MRAEAGTKRLASESPATMVTESRRQDVKQRNDNNSWNSDVGHLAANAEHDSNQAEEKACYSEHPEGEEKALERSAANGRRARRRRQARANR